METQSALRVAYFEITATSRYLCAQPVPHLLHIYQLNPAVASIRSSYFGFS